MAETLFIDKALPKDKKYTELLPQLKSLLEGEADLVANMANFCAALKEVFEPLWVGFYLVKDKELVLGPFQGPIACTRIAYGRGVCGSSWAQNAVLIVPDVEAFPGHIACSSLSRSEIVLPLTNTQGQVVAVLDIDSAELNAFDEVDQRYLQECLELLKA